MDYPLVKERMISRRKVIREHQISTPHYHDDNELYYMLMGRTTYFIDNEIYSVEQGDFVFVPKGLIHYTDNESCKNNERILLSFDDEFFNDSAGEWLKQLKALRIISITDNYRPVIEELLFKIEAEYRQREQGREFLLKLYIRELLILICRYRCEKKRKIRETDEIIYSVSEFIRGHFEQDITLESLGRSFAVSESYLSRKFKQVTGIGLVQYITFVRISNGERLLRESDLTVTEIAKRCGYNDSNYFTAVFKKIKGVTPLRYRKQTTDATLRKPSLC